MGRAFCFFFQKKKLLRKVLGHGPRAVPNCEAKSAGTLCICHPTYTPGYTLNKGVSRGVRRVAYTQGVSALPRHAHLHPKDGEGTGPRAQALNCQKKTKHGKSLKGGRTMVIYWRKSDGFSSGNGHVRPFKVPSGSLLRIPRFQLRISETQKPRVPVKVTFLKGRWPADVTL